MPRRCDPDSSRPAPDRAAGHIFTLTEPESTEQGRLPLAATHSRGHREVMATLLPPSSSLKDRLAGSREGVFDGRPSTTRLIGLDQIARILGVSAAEALELARCPDFPSPIGEICDHVLWSRKDVMGWHRLHVLPPSL